MCLIVFSYRDHATYPLIFAGNRDEFHDRQAMPAHFWEEYPKLLAGRDMKAGGTWLGVTTDGRFATVTNYREPVQSPSGGRRSRGDLVTDYLLGTTPTEAYLSDLSQGAEAYNGFNLIFGSAEGLYYFSNREEDTEPEGAARTTPENKTSAAAQPDAGQPDAARPGAARPAAAQPKPAVSALSSRTIEPGLHGLSNEQLDTPWPKVIRAKQLFRDAVDEGEPTPEALLGLLADSRPAPDAELSFQYSDPELERALSAIFIPGEMYGTRASTVVLIRNDGRVRFAERTFGPGGVETGTRTYEFDVELNDGTKT